MAAFESSVDLLERELTGVADTFAALTPEEWSLPTHLVPLDPDQPHWTVFELARPVA